MILANRRAVVTKRVVLMALAAVMLGGAPGAAAACSMNPFPTSRRMRSQLQVAEQAIMELYRQQRPVSSHGRFVGYRDGRMRFETDLRRADGAPVLALHGERISMDVLADRPWPPPIPTLRPPRE